jgi:hypothetical protein
MWSRPAGRYPSSQAVFGGEASLFSHTQYRKSRAQARGNNLDPGTRRGERFFPISRRTVGGNFSYEDSLCQTPRKRSEIVLRGLDPRIHVFVLTDPGRGCPWNRSGHGESKVMQSAALPCSCSKKLNRTAVGRARQAEIGVTSSLAAPRDSPDSAAIWREHRWRGQGACLHAGRFSDCREGTRDVAVYA